MASLATPSSSTLGHPLVEGEGDGAGNCNANGSSSSSSSTGTAPLCYRPPFPSGWQSLDLTPADLNLANTLPVGQSFLWHRRALRREEGGAVGVEEGGRGENGGEGEDEELRGVNGKMRIGAGVGVEGGLGGKESGENSSRSVRNGHIDHHTDMKPSHGDKELKVPNDITEEFSRVMSSPSPRVILLRQSRALSKIYYTSICPSDTSTTWTSTADEKQGTTAWMQDYFQLNAVPDLPRLYGEWRERDGALFGRAVPGPSGSGSGSRRRESLGVSVEVTVKEEREVESVKREIRDDELVPMSEMKWEAEPVEYNGDEEGSGHMGDPRGEGIRVLRQDPWECLIA